MTIENNCQKCRTEMNVHYSDREVITYEFKIGHWARTVWLCEHCAKKLRDMLDGFITPPTT